MRRRAAAKVQTNFIDIAPSPPFRRIVSFDDRMAGRMKMLGGVSIRRVVATANMSAGAAEPQMHPLRTGFQALLATPGARRHIVDRVLVAAFVSHVNFSINRPG